MKREIVWTTRFKKDYKLAMKRKLNIDLLDDIIRALSRGEELPEKCKDHDKLPPYGKEISYTVVFQRLTVESPYISRFTRVE